MNLKSSSATEVSFSPNSVNLLTAGLSTALVSLYLLLLAKENKAESTLNSCNRKNLCMSSFSSQSVPSRLAASGGNRCVSGSSALSEGIPVQSIDLLST